jgi:two-component system OmpR family sensor kinase
MKSYSIMRRLVIWLTVSTITFWAIGAALGAYVMHDEFGEIFDSAMQQTAERLLPLVLDDISDDDTSEAPRRLQKSDNISDGYLSYQVRQKDGRVLMHSFETPPAPFKAPLVVGFWEGEGMRVFTTAETGGTVFVQVADSLAHRTEAMQDGVLALLLPLIVLVPISVMILLFIIGRVTHPLGELRAAIVEKDSGNLSPLETGTLPNELRPIANSLNIVLARLSAALVAEREFTANSAHELRTPIAGAIAQAQLIIAELGSSGAVERAILIEQSLQRLALLTEKLLQLSRAEAGIGMAAEPSDLMPIIDMVVEDFRRQIGPSRRIDLISDLGARIVRAVNTDAFGIVLRNLIENAISHGDHEKPVTVRIDGDGQIIVSNAARQYTAEELLHVRKRFNRANDLAPGSGLGLSIVERLLVHMNASLELRSRPEKDVAIFEAIVRFG